MDFQKLHNLLQKLDWSKVSTDLQQKVDSVFDEGIKLYASAESKEDQDKIVAGSLTLLKDLIQLTGSEDQVEGITQEKDLEVWASSLEDIKFDLHKELGDEVVTLADFGIDENELFGENEFSITANEDEEESFDEVEELPEEEPQEALEEVSEESPEESLEDQPEVELVENEGEMGDVQSEIDALLDKMEELPDREEEMEVSEDGSEEEVVDLDSLDNLEEPEEEFQEDEPMEEEMEVFEEVEVEEPEEEMVELDEGPEEMEVMSSAIIDPKLVKAIDAACDELLK